MIKEMPLDSVGTFSFLNDECRGPLLGVRSIKSLAENLNLSTSDGNILNEILASIEKDGTLPFKISSQEKNYLERHGQKEWIRYLIYRYKFVVYPKKKILSDFPVYLLIEPTSVCNLRCVMCYQADESFTRQPFMGMMDYALFRRIVDEAVAEGAGGITLASRGEPTLHKKLPQMLEYLAGKFFEVKLTTNATRLTEALIHMIISTGVNMVVFSVDSHQREVYEEIRVGGEFDTVYRNIQLFHEIRDKYYPNSQTVSRISAVQVNEDQDPELFCKFWQPLVDEVGMKSAATRWDTYNNDPIPNVEEACAYLWERLYVWHDGSTSPCDADYKSALSIGSIADSTVREIWHGTRMNEIRNMHANVRRSELYPCDRCGINY